MRVFLFVVVNVFGNYFYDKGSYYNAAIFGAMAITVFIWSVYDKARK